MSTRDELAEAIAGFRRQVYGPLETELCEEDYAMADVLEPLIREREAAAWDAALKAEEEAANTYGAAEQAAIRKNPYKNKEQTN